MIWRLAPRETWALRRAVLHPARPLPTEADPRDVVPDALHLGWREDGDTIACGSIAREALPEGATGPAWRVRGLAVLAPWRGRGIGGRLLDALLDHARSLDPQGLAWCLGRIEAERFYARHGFRRTGEVEVEGKGLRLLLRRSLGATAEESASMRRVPIEPCQCLRARGPYPD